MSHRPAKIDKASGGSALPGKTRSTVPKKNKMSFDDAFTAAFKHMNDSQSAFSKLDHMQISFRKNLFNPVIPMTPQKPAASSGALSEAPASSDFKDVLKVVMRHEGTAYVKMDGGREPSKMGILQSTARQYGYAGDIKNITRTQAEAIYKKIWNKSGAANLSYPLSVIHFDTYVNSPAAARKILKQSGGDVDTYLQLREQRYIKLASARPQRYGRYLNGWMNRVNDLKMVAAEYAKSHQAGGAEIASAKKTGNTA